MKNWICKLSVLALALLLAASAVGCGGDETETSGGTTAETAGETTGETSAETSGETSDATIGETTGETTEATAAETTPDAPPATEPESTPSEPVTDSIVKITFSAQGASGATSEMMIVEGNAFVIVKPGTYELTGDLSNGQLRVRVADTERVTLIFNNFTASSSSSAPIYFEEADKVVIELAVGSVNRLVDAKTYQFSDPAQTKPNACLYAGCDLKIKGKGSLIVEGNYNNGIGCKKDLEITNGTITVSAPNNIVKGNNSVTISGGSLTLSGGEDAIKSDEELKQGKGYILISEDAVLDITCSDDALQATQSVTVEATAKLTVSCGGDAVNCPGTINVPNGVITLK